MRTVILVQLFYVYLSSETLQKGSPHIKSVNKQLQFLHERNFIDTWIEELMANFSNCDTITKIVNSHGEGVKSLSIDHLQSFFYIIFAGLILATWIVVVEMLEGRGRNIKQKKRARQSKQSGRRKRTAWQK